MSDELMKRPTINDDYVRRRAAEIILPAVMSWGRYVRERDEPQVIKDLMKAARVHGDGYEMAKSLEGFSWSVDDGLVEILGSGWVDDAIEELTDQWVRCLNIKPDFALGDRVVCHIREEAGFITRIDTKLAKYGVRYSDMKDNSYYQVPFELCQKASAEVAA